MNIENIGMVVLYSYAKYPSNNSYNIIDNQNNVVVHDGIRMPLKNILRPNLKEETEIIIQIPKELDSDRIYKIQITMVAENYFWFGSVSSDFIKEIELNILL